MRRPSAGSGRAASKLGGILGSLAVAGLAACSTPTAPIPDHPQTVVLFATPKFLADFTDPAPGVAAFLEHYEPLTSRAAETIVIFAVGNSEHILRYRGRDYWDDGVEWARYTDDRVPMSDRTMNYHEIDGIVRAFREHAAATGLRLKVFDQIDKGIEFTHNHFKNFRHPECFSREWESWDVQARLAADDSVYASAPAGIQDGKSCGEFLVDQADHYMEDLGFDGILYGNQLGTRGHWLPENGPGYSAAEADAIRDFLEYSERVYGERELMWFDTYNNIDVERESFSFPGEGYAHFDYIIASGFCVITFPARYLDNLRSKLSLRNRTRVIATLDYVDPWYSYDSMIDFPEESANLERVAIEHRHLIDGLVFFANDENGALVPRDRIESFAERFFGPRPST